MENLLFRRQYLLSNVNIEIDSNWNCLELPGTTPELKLYSHPDLEITYQQHQATRLVLIGYIIDPLNPDLSNGDILNKLINASSLQNLLKESENYSGRFALILCKDDRSYIFHDATGFREIYYYFRMEEVYCGSTPDIINKYAKVESNLDTSINKFVHSTEYKTSGFWVGTSTPFLNIFHLQPNFYLDVNTKTCYRYWPYEHRKEISLKDAAVIMAQILKGTLHGAVKRYELHQGLTSGFDSRVLLAASKDVKDQIQYVVNRSLSNIVSLKADIKAAMTLAAKHDLKLDVVDLKSVKVDENFKAIFYRNNVFARETYQEVFYKAYKDGLDNTYWVTGTFGNEILRIAFPLKKKAVSSKDIAKCFHYDNDSYAIDSIEEWLGEAKHVIQGHGYNLINFFYWEQFTGNWENLGGSEGAIVREELRLFNCRKFITTYLSLKDKYRYKDYPMGHVMIIKILWNELLHTPVAAYTDKPSYWIKRITRLLGIEILIDNIYNHLKTRISYGTNKN